MTVCEQPRYSISIQNIDNLKYYMRYTGFTIYDLAVYFGTSFNIMTNILNGTQAITDEMYKNFYNNMGFELFTNDFIENAQRMKTERYIKAKKLWDKYCFSKRVLKSPKFLCLPKVDFINKEQLPIFLSLKEFRHPLAGMALKFYRAAHNETQYTLPEKLRLLYNDKQFLSVCNRDFWHNVETKDYISGMGNRALYLLTGYSLEQMADIYTYMLQCENIPFEENTIEQVFINCSI